MKPELSPEQSAAQDEFRRFVDDTVSPQADEYDQRKCLPDTLISLLGERGYLAPHVSAEFRGRAWGPIISGLLFEQVGRGSVSLLSLLAVHGMVAQAVARWGSEAQKRKWLPRLVAGEAIGAFALTEPNFGSDASGVETSAARHNGRFVLTGSKQWTSFGLRADLFLVFAGGTEGAVALLVERGSPGLSVSPAGELMSFRATQPAALTFDRCAVPAENLLGRAGFGFSHVANTCLDFGRYCIACGSVGLAQACLDASLSYTSKRRQFGKILREHQLIQRMLTNMVADTRAARMLCYRAGYLREINDPSMITETAIAKYFAARTASAAAADAVQMHGANGFSCAFPVQRYFRDAKALEMIEGSAQILQIMIARNI